MLVAFALVSADTATGEEVPRRLGSVSSTGKADRPVRSARIVSIVDPGHQTFPSSAAPPRLCRPMVDDSLRTVSHEESVVLPESSRNAESTDGNGRPQGVWRSGQRRFPVAKVPAIVFPPIKNEPVVTKELSTLAQEPLLGELSVSGSDSTEELPKDAVPLSNDEAAASVDIAAAPDSSAANEGSKVETPARPSASIADDHVKPATHLHQAQSSLLVPNSELAAPTQPRHVIQLGDELDIAFPYQPVVGDATMQRLQTPIFRTERVIVREDGMIVLPLIEPVPAAGLTPEEVRDLLIERYLPFQYDPLANLNQKTPREYRLCVNDELDIRVRNQPDLDDVVTIRPDGRISVPRVGSVVVEGKTVEEVESELTEAISKVVAQPEVSVSLRQFHSDIYYEGSTMKRMGLKNLEGISVIVRSADRRVFVMGEVKGAGQVGYRGTMTLSQAIASAGGTLRTAKLKEVKIVRQTGPQSPPQTILVDFRSTIRGRGVQDVELHHLDVVVVGKTPIARFTDTLEQYLFNIVPFTRNNPNFNLFYSLGGGASAAGIVTPSP